MKKKSDATWYKNKCPTRVEISKIKISTSNSYSSIFELLINGNAEILCPRLKYIHTGWPKKNNSETNQNDRH